LTLLFRRTYNLELFIGEGGANRDRSSSAGGGGWRVLLMNYEKHDEKTVVKAITRVVPNTDENHAKVVKHCLSSFRLILSIKSPPI
jgi:hypothetical protein